jgi:hypothetical protein
VERHQTSIVQAKLAALRHARRQPLNERADAMRDGFKRAAVRSGLIHTVPRSRLNGLKKEKKETKKSSSKQTLGQMWGVAIEGCQSAAATGDWSTRCEAH